VPRYKCKECDSLFSSHTFLKTYNQKKPQLNQAVFKWYSSATTQRRMAKVLGVNRKTVVRKFLFMAKLARAAHEQKINSGELKTSFAQFDEVETFEHTKLLRRKWPQ
jgi:transposase-like protein